jgi:hypothetical protein
LGLVDTQSSNRKREGIFYLVLYFGYVFGVFYLPVMGGLELVLLELLHIRPEVAVVWIVVVELQVAKPLHTRLWDFPILVGDKLATHFHNELPLGEDFLPTRRLEEARVVGVVGPIMTVVVVIVGVHKPTVEGHTRVLEVIWVLVKRDSGRPPTVADAILGFVPLMLLPLLNGVPHNLASGGLVFVVNGENVFAEGADSEALVH